MIYKIDYSKDATKVIKKWKKSNKPLFEKLRKVLNSIAETPREGIGQYNLPISMVPLPVLIGRFFVLKDKITLLSLTVFQAR